MRDLHFRANGQELTRIGSFGGLVAGSEGYLRAVFAFSADWDGVRVIPDPISAEQAYGLDELGWQDGHIWRSRMDGNVYPVTQTDAWERVS